ncbi:MAG: CHAD domain-containing protein [Chthoniobacterales bacterium]|nr:CHAD domain-containing protein [Chthoniobacterales bacterium]
MGFKLREDETLGEGVRRICCEEIEGAITASKTRRNGKASPVHETRKHLKRARAALRLVAGKVERDVFKREHHRLRNVARVISDIRDAEVRLETVKQLRAITSGRGDRQLDETEELLAFELDSFLAAFSDWHTEAASKLARSQAGIGEWRLRELDRKHICNRLRKAYKEGRDALDCAKQDGTAESFHTLRKQAKELWYQLQILRPLHPVIFQKMSEDLQTIGERLGHMHDLSFVGERLDTLVGAEGRKRGRRALGALIDSREKDLQRTAVALGERFYAERPKEFAARIAEYFEEWERAKLRRSAELVETAAQTRDLAQNGARRRLVGTKA